MDGEHSIKLSELVLLQVVLGLPVFLINVLVQGFYLRKVRRLHFLPLIVAVISTLVAALPGSLVVWAFWPFSRDIMALEFVNLPALISCLLLTPLSTFVFIQSIFKDTKRSGKQSEGESF